MAKHKKQKESRQRKSLKRKARLKKQKAVESERARAVMVEQAVEDALIRAEEGDMKDARRVLSRLSKNHSNNMHLQYGLGVMAAYKEEWDNAIDFFDRAIAISPKFLAPYHGKAFIYKKTMDFANLIRTLLAMVDIGSPDENDLREAREFLDQIRTGLAENEGLTIETFLKAHDHFEKGRVHEDMGDPEKAIEHLKEAIHLNPHPPQAYGNMGICYAKLGKRQKAIEAFDKALEIDPDYQPAALNKAVVEKQEPGNPLNLRIEEINYYGNYMKYK